MILLGNMLLRGIDVKVMMVTFTIVHMAILEVYLN